MTQVAIIGGGSWGTALAVHLAKQERPIIIFDPVEKQVGEINEKRTNSRYLPEIILPEKIKASTNLEEVISGAESVFLVVPSHVVKEIIQKVRPYLRSEQYLLSCSKGLDEESLERLSQVIIKNVPPENRTKVAVLSGPTHAEEVSRGLPSAAVVASENKETAKHFQDIIMDSHFRIYSSPDVIGVELGGAVKNIIAIAAGICDGMGFGDNTKAALITRGLSEISRLGKAEGAKPETFSGLAGLGDLVVTCASKHSRNWNFGYRIGQGKSTEQALKEINQTVEGLRTTQTVYQLAQRSRVEMPITHKVYQVLFQGLSPQKGVYDLMGRLPKVEMEEQRDGTEYW